MSHDNDDLNEFERIAITRDLVRKPEIKFLAGVLYNLATGSVDKTAIPPVYVMIAHRIITRPSARAIIIQAIEAAS